MASLAFEAGSTLHQETLADFVLIRTDDIDVGDRLRPVDPVWAEALGQIMAREGQDTPIQVCRLPGRTRWTLVAGAHRHAGAVSAEIEYLRAEIVSADRDDRRLREVRENLWRSELAPVDRAAFVAEVVAIHKRRAGIDPAVDGRVASIATRWQKAVKNEAVDTTVTMTVVYGFTDAVASELGLSASSVERDLMLYRRLAPSLVERLRLARHPILSNGTQLRTLAKLDEREQSKVVSLLTEPGASLNYGQPKTVADAISHPLGPKPAKIKPDADSKNLSAFLSSFQRMTPSQQKGALAALSSMLPVGVAIRETNPVPAVPVRASVKADHLVCLDCGEQLERLPTHLAEAHDLQPVEYLAKWKLPLDYPFVAPALTAGDDA